MNQLRDISVIKNIYLYALNPKISTLYPGLKRVILRILLEALTKEGKAEAEFFEDFIKNPSQSDQVFSKKVILKWVPDYNGYSFITEPSTSIAELVTNHLKLLHRSGFDVTKFDHYFNADYVKKLRTEYQLKAGEKIDRILETFTKTELDFLNDEKILSFVNKPREFSTDGNVVLQLEIKNIPKLTLKVFEINTGNYCRELLRNVEDNVKLDGLVSISEQTFKYSQPSIVSHIETFEIPKLNEKKRGVFVIDFIGEGTTSRTIIRKGYLSLLTKKTRTGYNCKILDEQSAVCKGEHTGVYLESKFYKAEADGTIRVEYPSYANTHNLVLEHENFFYVVSEKLTNENISVVANWIYSEETFLPGNKCNLALKVSMYVSGSHVPASINIKDTKIETEFRKGQ